MSYSASHCAWLCFSLLAAAVYAEPGLHYEPMYGPLSERFAESQQTALIAGRPLLPDRSRGLIEYKVEVDSLGMIHYGRRVSGFSEGPTVTVEMDDYLNLEYGSEQRQIWRKQIRRDFRSTALEQRRRRKGGRFEWTVPFSAPKPLRRFIGEEGPSLSLNGSRTIIISGKSEWTDGQVQTSIGRPSKFPALAIDQESKFTVEGKVGELINVRINQDTESIGSAFGSNLGDQLANQIKLDYHGEDDAIFQEIQGGNTTLELPNTRFVGFRQQNKGLFGIRAKGHLGPFAFTTVASHEKSKSNRQSFKGGAAVDTLEIKDHQYVPNTYFFLHEFYRANLPDFRQLLKGAQFGPENFIDINRLEVYINDFNTNNDAELFAKPGIAWVDASDTLGTSEIQCFDAAGGRLQNSGCFEEGTWHRLDPDDDYTVVAEAGYIILNRVVNETHAMAVHFKALDPGFDGPLQSETARLNASTASDSLQLKLIKARNARPGFPTWNLEWKNVYRIATGFSSGRKFDPKTLLVDIVKEVPGQEDQLSQNGRAFLQLLGLDERGKDPGSPSDRVIDADYIGLDDYRGHLIFPDQRPFDARAPKYRGLIEKTIPEIYDNQQQRDKIEASRYTILVRAASSEQRIRLGGAFGGVRAETVEVRLNGRGLTRGSDYNVDFVGNVTFVGNVAQEVADPGADLEITFESEDVFGLGSQQKTLLGLRTEYEFWGGDGRMGSTMIYNNERSSERRVRIGNEPKRTVIWNFDLRARRESPILTRIVDMLPLIKTAVPSEVVLDAEIAQSRPNLNTKGKGYIDDFEGSERPTSLAIGRTRWSPSSVLEDSRYGENERGRFIWYNPFDGVQRTDIWPNQEEQLEAQNRRADILALELAPNARAAESWGGIVAALSAVNDFSQSKFLEIWVRGEEGILHVNLGDQINEDYVANGRLDTEDEPFPGRSTGDGLVSKEEDLGVDGRDDEAELNFYLLLQDASFDTTASLDQRKQAFNAFYGESTPLRPNHSADDPEGDNWKYDPQRNKNDYSRINGTQRNKVDLESGDRPDSEDLNNNGVLDQRNNYYHYQIDLASNRYEVPGTHSQGWRQIRVPLFGDHVLRAGLPDSSRIEYARLMLSHGPFADSEATALAEIALIEVVGNEWQEDDVTRLDERYIVGEEEALDVTVIGTDKSLSYRPPPGVKLRRNVQSRTREREQSLVLAYDGLEPGHQMSATKILNRAANYTSYQRLRMYAYGDSSETIEYVHGDSSDMVLFMRFGADSTNYYEVISPIFPGWEGGRAGWKGNQVDVDLLVISKLKALAQSGRVDTTTGEFYYTYQVRDPRGAPIEGKTHLSQDELQRLRAEGYDPSVDRFSLDQVFVSSGRRGGEPAIYRVRGNPSMQSIKQLSIGLRNRADNRRYSGRVFLDELRLDEARNDPGFAAYAKFNTKLADFMNIDGNVLWRQEDFRTFAGSGGNSTDREAGMSASSNMQKLLPGSWGFSVPVKVNLNRVVSLPRFGPGSDVELTSEEKREQQSVSTKEFYDVSISRRQGKNFLLRWTLDQMNLRLSHSRENSSDPVRLLNEREAQTMSFNYRMPLPKPSLQILSWLPEFVPKGLVELRFRPLPSSLTYTMNGSRRVSRLLHRGDATPTEQEDFGLNETYASKLNPFQGLSADYNLKIDRDLRKKFVPDMRSFGREVGRKQTADVSFSLRLVQWLDQNYTFKANYVEQNDPAQRRGSAPIDSTTGAPFKTFDIDTKNDLSMRFNFKLPQLLKRLGKSSAQGRKAKKKKVSETDEAERPPALEAATGEAEAEPQKRNSPFILRRLVGWTGNVIEPINVNWRRNTNARNFNLIARPPILFQLGIADSLKVRRATQGLTTQDNSSQTSSLEASSGLRLPFGMSLKVNSNEQTTQRSGSSQDRLRLQRERRFPRLNLNWGRADRLPYLKKVNNSAQVNMNFETSTSSEGEGSLSDRDLITEGASTEFRLSWNGRWRWGPTTTIERVVSTSESRDFELASAESDSSAFGPRPLRGTSSNERSSTTFKVTYNLKPRSLPLFGKLKSDVTLNFEFGIEGATRANATADETRTPITETDRWKTELSMSYSFSENFRGSGLIRIENNNNKLTDKTRKTRELRLSGTFFLR
ncbi:MAG TPA: cell surface protein SprA [Candidatus Latescibacteria bacterium]|nr:cell surface protein SprA [Candidatus Latescibacterota bacterium]